MPMAVSGCGRITPGAMACGCRAVRAWPRVGGGIGITPGGCGNIRRLLLAVMAWRSAYEAVYGL